ncbi:hypothetical protein E1B28_007003 [Marasmius oreades]|uniref:Uncharacterized protein n=1 Tax=Marasmius oreades TaxID=181124 RepID=A0A9P7S238_9AGAR|nr:uncharacterized protein E1B28_007003 [Marasmius oreades]KAG7093321.1 hypothetical protein E1B28_007003 [Marasmius oreades]
MSQSHDDNIEHWIEAHHRVEPASKSTNNQEIHVFAVQRTPVFGSKASAGTCYDVSWSFGPATFSVEACFDISSGSISICLYVKIPFFSKQKLGCATGSITEGISIGFDWKIVSGKFTFTIKDKWLWLHYDVKVLGTSWNGDLKLIPLPFL